MLDYFFLVGKQVTMLLLMMCVGFLCGKKKIFSDVTVQELSRFVTLIVIPATAISGMQIPYSHTRMLQFGLGLLVAAGSYLFDFVIAWPLFRRYPTATRGLLATGASLTNAGFVGYPIMTALIGAEGIFFGMPYGLFINFYAWTIGAAFISGDRKNVSFKNIFSNFTVIACLVGLALFIFNVRLPVLSMDFMAYFVNMNMAVPMIITGYYLSKTDLKAVVLRKTTWTFSLVRLLVLPLMTMGLLRLLGLRGDMFIAATVANAVPPASYMVILSTYFQKHTQEASELSSFCTLLSVVTLPLILTLAKLMA